MPVMPIRMEDLPLPFGPVIAHASPSATRNVASCTATTFPYDTDSPLTASATLPPTVALLGARGGHGAVSLGRSTAPSGSGRTSRW